MRIDDDGWDAEDIVFKCMLEVGQKGLLGAGVFQGGRYTPDQIQDLFRALGSDTAILLDGGGSSAIVVRRDSGGMWAGAGVPQGSCDTYDVLCDAHERAQPSWLAFN